MNLQHGRASLRRYPTIDNIPETAHGTASPQPRHTAETARALSGPAQRGARRPMTATLDQRRHSVCTSSACCIGLIYPPPAGPDTPGTTARATAPSGRHTASGVSSGGSGYPSITGCVSNSCGYPGYPYFFQQRLWLSLSLDVSATAPDITSIPGRASLCEEGAVDVHPWGEEGATAG